jgi:hypothetical protein
LLKKEDNSLVYTTTDGEVIKQFRKAWERNDNGSLDKVMADIAANPHKFDKKSSLEDAPVETDEQE